MLRSNKEPSSSLLQRQKRSPLQGEVYRGPTVGSGHARRWYGALCLHVNLSLRLLVLPWPQSTRPQADTLGRATAPASRNGERPDTNRHKQRGFTTAPLRPPTPTPSTKKLYFSPRRRRNGYWRRNCSGQYHKREDSLLVLVLVLRE